SNNSPIDESTLSSISDAPEEPGPDSRDQSGYYRRLLQDVFEVMRSVEDHQQKLLQMIKGHAPFHQIRNYLDQVLPDKQATKTEEASKKAKVDDISENDTMQPRPHAMDISYLCDNAPCKVPAKPWTNVTDDDDLVSHLVSLYMTWDYPFYAFFDRKTFLENMAKGNLNSDFCSPFLVNALLANACDYSQYAEVYTIAGDTNTKGAAFLAEAESYMRTHSFERGGGTRLATLQATLLLYERYSVLGNEDFGYTMLHRAIEMAEELGIVNCDKLNLRSSQLSEDMIRSIQRTAWGIFQIDTIVHTNFLKPSRVHEVSVHRLPREDNGKEDWTPYPISSQTRPSYMNQYFDEACSLSYIARDISRSVQIAEQKNINVNEVKQDVYNRLREWEAKLPEVFNPKDNPAPHILLLRMRYHALMINLCCDNFGSYSSFATMDKRVPMNLDPGKGYSALDVAISSARQISIVVQMMRKEYGMRYVHQFAMYAVNVAIYTLLEQPSFDILDPDFLHLTGAFAAISSRSQVGKSLYHFFKLSVRSRDSGHRLDTLDEIPSELKEIFAQVRQVNEPTKSGNDTKSPHTLENNTQSMPSPGLKDMIGEYEKLSVGKEERPFDHRESANFDF
ncbi:pathway-specific regulatory protein, partial [Penicillium brevicompactum]